MKQKTSRPAVPGIILLALGLYSFYYFSGPPVLTPAEGVSDPDAFRFTIVNLPDIAGDDAEHRIFVSHGDGSYFMGSKQQLAGHERRYAYDNNPYSAFAEVIALYDDNKKPPGRTAPVDISPATASTPSPAVSLGANKITLARTTNPVPGDSVTYIVTYEHPGGSCGSTLNGAIEFTYDTLAFHPLTNSAEINTYFAENLQDLTGAAPGHAVKQFGFSGLAPGEQRSLFIRLATRSEARAGTSLGTPTNVRLTFERNSVDGCGSLTGFVDTIRGELIASGHDPNFKTLIDTDLCTSDSITWRIDFQNQGNGPVDSVVVADWIDTLTEFRSVRVVDAKFTVAHTYFMQSAREVRVVMRGVRLRGLGEQHVSEDSTRGYVVLRGKISERPNCNAIVNAARIFFDCNPPVTTRPVLAELPCADSLCLPCVTTADTLVGPLGIPPGGDSLFNSAFLNPGLYAALISSGEDWTYKWYPAADLDDPGALFPILTRPVRRTYTLVASNAQSVGNNCQRIVIRVAVRPAQSLTLNTGWTATGGCPDNPVWTLTATAAGAPAANLVWHDCSSGVEIWSKGNLSAQQVYVAVWDTLSGDYAEQWVNLPHSCQPENPWWPPRGIVLAGAILLALLIAGGLAMRFFRRKP